MILLRFCVLSCAIVSTTATLDQACSTGDCLEATSLLQDVLKRNADSHAMDRPLSLLTSKQGRKDSMNRLLDAATSMIKNGVTPDVVLFINSTVSEIEGIVYPAIIDEHTVDQTTINTEHALFAHHIGVLNSSAVGITAQYDDRQAAFADHRTCRVEEGSLCAETRECHDELERLWEVVVTEEITLRQWHREIELKWCAPADVPIFDINGNPFTFEAISPEVEPYPVIEYPAPVTEFRVYSVTKFALYTAQLVVVQTAWTAYTTQLTICEALASLADQSSACDQTQSGAETMSCTHATLTRDVRKTFGHSWHTQTISYETAISTVELTEYDRKREWETLHIVLCLLGSVYDRVEDSIETGEPCPTDSSDEEGVTLAIDACHYIAGNLTIHLDIIYPDPPDPPALPPVVSHACEHEYGHVEYTFPSDVQDSYLTEISGRKEPQKTELTTYLTENGWPACAAVTVCSVCSALTAPPANAEYTQDHAECKLHETYLAPGESDSTTFRCFNGGCIAVEGLCNSVSNCGDNSDEDFCNGTPEPPHLLAESTCPAGALDFSSGSSFQCGGNDGGCVSLSRGRCNNFPNCADMSDEADCSSPSITAVATSGRKITVESYFPADSSAFWDREYTLTGVEHFWGASFIKASNDDKDTLIDHEMWKIDVSQPVTVFVVEIQHESENHYALEWTQALSWLDDTWLETTRTGVGYKGARSTRDKDWEAGLSNTYELLPDNYTPSKVWEKSFPAGTITIPGNGGNDGLFLLFIYAIGEGGVNAPQLLAGEGGVNAPQLLTDVL